MPDLDIGKDETFMDTLIPPIIPILIVFNGFFKCFAYKLNAFPCAIRARRTPVRRTTT